MRAASSLREFSTKSVRPEASVATWRRMMSEVYYGLDIRSAHADRLDGSIKEVGFGLLSVSSVTTNAQRVLRSAQAANTDKSDSFVFVFQTNALMSFSQRNQNGTLAPGQVLILNSAEPYECGVQDGSDNITLKVPCSLLRPNSKGFDAACGRGDIADPEIVPLVRSFATNLLTIRGTEAALRLQTVCLDLLTIMIDAGQSTTGARRSTCLSDILYGDLVAFIRRNLADSDLTVERAADWCQISIRFVQKIFQQRGTTFGRVLMRQRLEQADRLLRSPSPLSIGEIAYRCGFSNQAHFSTRYRQQFGLSPRESRSLSVSSKS